MDFDLQSFLRDMRAEQMKAHERLTDKVDLGFATITSRAEQIAKDLVVHQADDLKAQSGIDSRLQRVEGLHSNLTWLTRAGITAIVGLLIDLFWNHIPKWVK